VNKFVLSTPIIALALTLSASAQQPQNKIGIIHIQNAIFNTKDGQTALQALQKKFEPKKAELESKQKEIEALKAQLAKGGSVMAAEARDKITRDINLKTTQLNRDTEDAQAELDGENQRVMQDLGGKMMTVLDKYSKDNGYALILDVSPQSNQVLYAANGIDVTVDVVKLYDANAPAATAPPAATPAASKPAAPLAAPKKK